MAVVRAHTARTTVAPYLAQQATPRQQEFLDLACLEALYGGAAGGGKSSALLMAALQHVHVPGYSALLLRRTYADLALPGAIMDRSHTWLQGSGATWNGTDKRWTFPSGAVLTFGYLDTEKDKFRYASAEFQYIGFDELTQFPENWYRFLLSRLRRPVGITVPVRARAASNPGGIGHDWVRRRFVEANDPDRRFVAANLRDNPHVDGDEYRRSLAQLDATTRRQLEDGVWIRDSGGLVYSYDPQRNDTNEAPALNTYLLGLDFGVVDENGVCVLGWRDNDPCVYVVEAYRFKGGPSEMAEEAKRLEARYKFVRIVGDVGGLGKAYAEEMRRRFGIPVEPAEKQNKRGYISLLNGDLERGRVRLLPACADLKAEWLELPWSEDRTKPSEGFADHSSDATLYAWRAASAYHEQPEPAPPTLDVAMREMEARLIEQREGAVTNAGGEWWAR
jgi:hypothetical protein